MTNKTEWEGLVVIDEDRELADAIVSRIRSSLAQHGFAADISAKSLPDRIARYRVEATATLEAERDALREALESVLEWDGRQISGLPFEMAQAIDQALAISEKSE